MIATDILVYKKGGVVHRDLKKHLIRYGLTTISAQTETALQRLFHNRKPAIILICSNLQDVTEELKIVEQIRRQDKNVPIIFITRYSSEAAAIAALRAGVNDFFKTPLSYKELALSIRKNFPGDLIEHPAKNDKKVGRSINGPIMVGDSSPMRKVQSHILKLAQTDSTVLVTGETGTGKELATKTIHCHSPRCKNPLICINCAAIPDSLVESELFGYERGAFTGAVATKTGRFEAAACGTIFLDEIGDMTPFAQAKILRTIEMKKNNRLGGKREKRLDFRVIAATNQDPEKLVTEKRFRKDLYYRLNVARVYMPPLRDRKEDIPQLIGHYIDRFNHRFGRNVIGFTEAAKPTLPQCVFEAVLEEAGLDEEIDFKMKRLGNEEVKTISAEKVKDIYKDIYNDWPNQTISRHRAVFAELDMLGPVADRLCKNGKHNVVIFGHSHKNEIDEDKWFVNDRIYANTGFWCGARCTFVETERTTKYHKVRTVQWMGEKRIKKGKIHAI